MRAASGAIRPVEPVENAPLELLGAASPRPGVAGSGDLPGRHAGGISSVNAAGMLRGCVVVSRSIDQKYRRMAVGDGLFRRYAVEVDSVSNTLIEQRQLEHRP